MYHIMTSHEIISYHIISYHITSHQSYTTWYNIVVSHTFQTIWQLNGIDNEFEPTAH